MQHGHAVCGVEAARPGCTALIWACVKDMESVALKLLQSGPDVRKPDQVNMWSSTALMWACKRGLNAVGLRLLELGLGKPGSFNHEGNTALIMACESGHETLALQLLKLGRQCTPHHVNKAGKCALSYAHENDMHAVVARIQTL